MQRKKHSPNIVTLIFLAFILSSCGSQYNNTDDTGEMRRLTSLRELQGTYKNQAINHRSPGAEPNLLTPLSNKLMRYWSETKPIPFTFRINYVNEQQLQLMVFDAQGGLLQQKTITSPEDFVFKNGRLMTSETTIDQNKSTNYSKDVLIGYSLNDRGNLVNHYEADGAGLFLYIFPGVTRVRINYEYERLSN